ncbi:hypothetical protein Tco_1360819 [Tanacetum coccineum]
MKRKTVVTAVTTADAIDQRDKTNLQVTFKDKRSGYDSARNLQRMAYHMTVQEKSVQLIKNSSHEKLKKLVTGDWRSNWQVHDAIADDILDDLLKREWEKQQHVKYDKRKVTKMKILDLLEQRISRVGKHLKKAKEKMVMEREVIIIESDTSYDYFPFQATSGESSDHNPFQATSNESSDHKPFQATSDKSSYHNSFQVSSDDTLKSSSKDTCSYDSSWEQKKLLKVNQVLDQPKGKRKLFMVNKGRAGSSSKNAVITKPDKPKSSSKHFAPTIPRTGSTCTTLVVPTKRPPPVTNCVLCLVAVTTWQQILNKEFRIKISKEDVGGSLDVRRKGKRKMM